MRLLKDIYVLVLVLLLIIFGALFQINYVLNKTILSSRYIAGGIYKTNLDEVASKSILDKISNMSINDIQVFNMNINVNDTFELDIEKEWAKNQANIFLTGTHGYLVGEKSNLPIINISPIKRAIENVIIDEALTNKGVRDRLNNIIRSPIRSKEIGIEVEVIESIISHNTKENKIDTLETQRQILRIIINQNEKIRNIDTFLDINNLHTRIFEGEKSPIWGIRNITGAYKSTMSYLIPTIIILLLITIIAAELKLVSILRLMSAGFVCSAILAILSGGSISFLPTIVSLPQYFGYDGNLFDLLNISSVAQTLEEYINLVEWITYILQDISAYLTIHGLILIAVGIILFILAKIKTFEKYDLNFMLDLKGKGNLVKKLKISTCTCLSISIVVISVLSINNLVNEIKLSLDTIGATESSKQNSFSIRNINLADDLIENIFKNFPKAEEDDIKLRE